MRRGGSNSRRRPRATTATLRTAATDAGTIRLRQGVDIDQVTVTIQKPLDTADAEKTTYSVEDDPQAASSTLEEILRKVPQLTIDAEGNVKLNGQSDFKVLVNGRSSAMFKNFKDVIRSMPASQITTAASTTTRDSTPASNTAEPPSPSRRASSPLRSRRSSFR